MTTSGVANELPLEGLQQIFQELHPNANEVEEVHSATPAMARILCDAFSLADHLAHAIFQLQALAPDKEKMQENIDKCLRGCTRVGVYKMPAHGCSCLGMDPLKQYEHILKDHAMHLFSLYGPLILCCSWFLESGHKFYKRTLQFI
jgi:hypothetical protein